MYHAQYPLMIAHYLDINFTIGFSLFPFEEAIETFARNKTNSIKVEKQIRK